MSLVTLVFSHSRTAEGIDVAAVVRSVWPEADIHPILDGSGAVACYAVTLSFADRDRALEAVSYLRAFCSEMGFEAEIDP